MKQSMNRKQYYVEGECEKKLIKTLIAQNLVIPGQIDVLNPVQEHIKSTHLRKLPSKTTVILIFDTDISNTDILTANLRFLSSFTNIREIITIPQVRNLEEELVRCTDIPDLRRIRDLINCEHSSTFKTAFIEEKRLYEKLQAHHFSLELLWSETPDICFTRIGIRNQGGLIKL